MMNENAVAGSPEELAAVRHLLDLGYTDPLQTAARQMAAERARQAALDQAEQLLRDGQAAEAIALLETAARNEPEWIAGRHWLARAYFRAGRIDETRELLDWLEAHGVEHPEILVMRAGIALGRRRLDEARDQAEYAKGLHAPLPQADVILGDVSFRRGDRQAADAAYRLAIKHMPRNAAAKTGLAAVALREESYEEAADWALRAIEDDPTRWQAHCHLGRALAQMERLAEARIALESSARLNSMRAAPYHWLAEVCELLGDRAGALSARQRAREVIARRRAAASKSAP